MIDRTARQELGRGRLEAERGSSRGAVEPHVGECDLALAFDMFLHLAAALTMLAAHFEQVGKIISK